MPVTVTLPETVEAFLNAKIGLGKYRDVAEYVVSLIDAERRREMDEQERSRELQKQIALGLEDLDRGDYADYDSAEELAARVKADGRKWLEAQKPSAQP